jgi:SAM-dependent methyltransferase
MKQADSREHLKRSVLNDFDTQSARYTERYDLPGTGEVLWPRHRRLLEVVDSFGMRPGANVLDAGCGPGVLSRDLARRGYVGVGVDGAPAMIRYCAQQAVVHGIERDWKYAISDVEALPLPDASFDLVISAGVIEYLPGDGPFLRELSRVLRPGGRLLLCVTNRYGYSESLHSLLYRIKKIPGVTGAASSLRRWVAGGQHGVMTLSFVPRRHRPREMEPILARHGLEFEADRFAHFTMLPSPLSTLAGKLTSRFDRKLERLDGTRLRVLGSCYLTISRRSA